MEKNPQINIESIWSEYRSQLKRFLLKRVSNETEVEDLLQEILIKTYHSLSHLKSDEKIKPWLYQIARNTTIDFYRQQAKNINLNEGELWYDEQDEEGKSPLKELQQCILPFIQALPTESAALLRAIELDGQSQKDYANANSIPYSTLKSRLQKSRRELQAIFEKCCEFSLDKKGNIIEYQQKGNNCDNC